MNDSRPPIPEEIKRSVRQRCGFGCVFCGLPVYEYDHIEDYSVVQEHNADLITLLCPTHHAEKTRKLRSKVQVYEANASPFNTIHGVTAPYGLHFKGTASATMTIGSDTFTSATNLFPIVIDNQPVIAFERIDDELGLYLYLNDEYNRPKVIIENNELLMRADAWDVSFEGQRLTVRDGEKRVFLRILFQPPASVTIERARILQNGVWIEVYPTEIRVLGSAVKLSGNRWDTEVGFTFGFSPHFIQRLPFLSYDTPRYSPEMLKVINGPILEAPEDTETSTEHGI